MHIIEKSASIKIFIDAKHIGACIRAARKRSGVSRRELAAGMKISNGELLRIESGRALMNQMLLTKLLCKGISNIDK